MTDLERIALEVADIKMTLATLIAWMAQSANSPIRHDEAMGLLKILNGAERQKAKAVKS